MKKILLVLAILVVSFACMLSAQTTDQFTGSLLWKVSGKGLDKPSYVFGTHHLASVSFVDSVAGLRAVMDDVEQVAGEILMSDMDAAQADMMQKGAMPADQSYKTILEEVILMHEDIIEKPFRSRIGTIRRLQAGNDQ